jgi:RHS repeat-associated protein
MPAVVAHTTAGSSGAHVHGPAGLVASRDGAGTVRFVRRDPRGSVLDGASRYTPAGAPVGTPAGPFGYRSELTALGLVHLRARDYDPGTRQFLTADPLDGVDGSPTLGNPYHYADNDPLNRADPSGLRPEDGEIVPDGVTAGTVAPAIPLVVRQCVMNLQVCAATALAAAALYAAAQYGPELAAWLQDKLDEVLDGPAAPAPRQEPDTPSTTIVVPPPTGENDNDDCDLYNRIPPFGGGPGTWDDTPPGRNYPGESGPYQEFVTRVPRACEYLLNGVWIEGYHKPGDGYPNGVLIDAKWGYGDLVDDTTGDFQDWRRNQFEQWEAEAQRQRDAAAPSATSVMWALSEHKVAMAMTSFFSARNIRFEARHVPFR